MKKDTLSIHSPIESIHWPKRILEIFRREDMKVIYDIYYHEVRTASERRHYCYIGGGLLKLNGFGRAAYRDVRRLLKLARLPDLSRAPRMLSESDAAKARDLDDGSSSG